MAKKDCWITVRCDPKTKNFIERVADARDMNVSEFIMDLVKHGAGAEFYREGLARQLQEIDRIYAADPGQSR
ncbi:MAG: hypothetical protein ABR985_00580 [Methanotrichaceae archaeon]|jgi:hypothetical protein